MPLDKLPLLALALATGCLMPATTPESDGAHAVEEAPLLARLRWDEQACQHSPPAGLTMGCGGVALETLAGVGPDCGGAQCYVPLFDIDGMGLPPVTFTEVYRTLHESHVLARGRVTAGMFRATEVWAPLLGVPPAGDTFRLALGCAVAGDACAELVLMAERVDGSVREPIVKLESEALDEASDEAGDRIMEQLAAGTMLVTGSLESLPAAACEDEHDEGACSARAECGWWIVDALDGTRTECRPSPQHCTKVLEQDACAQRAECTWYEPAGLPLPAGVCTQRGPSVLRATEVYLRVEAESPAAAP